MVQKRKSFTQICINIFVNFYSDTMLNKSSMVDTSSHLKHRDEVKLTQSIEDSKIRRVSSKALASIPTSFSLFSKVVVKLYSIDCVVENGKIVIRFCPAAV
ncbi:hypothetical protein Cni_G16278 [Canna indica]|uniref:Uncharacterized protein n=1 Tax=Canna indica TaxID=4628 RepID=A0AAQ3KFT0_9LILI|nr:hypothetical protein Cni_G16278 [Canna indica]